jgi:hypothetical protein
MLGKKIERTDTVNNSFTLKKGKTTCDVSTSGLHQANRKKNKTLHKPCYIKQTHINLNIG